MGTTRHYYDLTCEECGREFQSLRKGPRYCSATCANKASGARRWASIEDKPAVTVWSCGGGVESTAIATLIIEGRLPKPDLAVMTDVGYEAEPTWRHVRETLVPELDKVGVKLQVLKTTDWSNNDLFDRSGYLVIPAYRDDGGTHATKLGTHCNGTWKLKVVRRWLRSLGVKRCENWVGIGADEARRVRVSPYAWMSHRYPLVELNMGREDCVWAIARHGWAKPPRSACIICPQRSNANWLWLKENSPDDWAKAVKMDEEIRARDARLYLHRSLRPLGEVELRG